MPSANAKTFMEGFIWRSLDLLFKKYIYLLFISYLGPQSEGFSAKLLDVKGYIFSPGT